MASDQTVQSAVWAIELGRGKNVLRWVVVVLVALVLSLVYTSRQFRGLEKREAIDMAQLARHIARGEGFETGVIRPLSLWQLKTYRADHNPMFENHPDLYNPPLYPLMLAGLFRFMAPAKFEAKVNDLLYGPERWVIVPFNQLCLLLTLLLVYWWARQLFDQRVAVTAGLLLLFSDTLWSYGISGLPTTFLQLLLLTAVYCLFLADRRLHPPEGAAPASAGATAGLVVASAVLLGLCFLTRYLTLVLLLPMAWYAARVWRGRKAGLWAAIYTMISLAVLTPWLVRNYQISRSVLGIARYGFFENDWLTRSYAVDLSVAWSLRAMAGHFLTNLHAYWIDNFRAVGTDILIFFFVVGVMYEFRREGTSRLRRVLLGCLGTALLGMVFIGMPAETGASGVNGGNLLVLFLPVIAVFGCAFFYLLLDRITFRMQLTRAFAIGVFAVLNVAPMVFSMLPPRRGLLPYPPYFPPSLRLISTWFDKDETGVSDMPWAVAWYADRRAVWLPATPEEFFDIHDFVAPHNTRFILFTPYMLDRRYESEIIHGEYKPWASIMRGQLAEKFPLRSGTPLPPQNDLLLLADRVRWKEQQDTNTTKSTVSP